jgi:hypothetical protein
VVIRIDVLTAALAKLQVKDVTAAQLLDAINQEERVWPSRVVEYGA